MSEWVRYRFQTRSVEDYRPLVFDPRYPWWCSGTAGDGSTATIVAYLPEGEDLMKYWNDAHDIDAVQKETIAFSHRFPKPSYFVEQAS